MELEPIPKKTLEKWNKEFIELHKKSIVHYCMEIGVKFKTRKKLLKLYDAYINPNNIRGFLLLPPKLFIQYMVKDQLKDIIMYTNLRVKKLNK